MQFSNTKSSIKCAWYLLIKNDMSKWKKDYDLDIANNSRKIELKDTNTACINHIPIRWEAYWGKRWPRDPEDCANKIVEVTNTRTKEQGWNWFVFRPGTSKHNCAILKNTDGCVKNGVDYIQSDETPTKHSARKHPYNLYKINRDKFL